MTTTYNGTPPLPPARLEEPDTADKSPKDKRQNNATTGASAAGMRALTARLAAFYFRVPIKAFFRTRVDYLAYPRAINPLFQNPQRWSWRMTTPGILAHAVKTQGWSFIPLTVLPPLLANVTIGAVLYTTYLQTLGIIYEPASHASKRVYPPPSAVQTFSAGFVAGGIQSLLAAPLDALSIRFRTADLLSQRYASMWHYAWSKTRAIGTRGAMAGWGLSFTKDAFGYGAFFASFEFVKSQCFYEAVSMYYGAYTTLSLGQQREIDLHKSGERRGSNEASTPRPVIRPHYLMEPGFILLAGIAASVAQQAVQHPLQTIQEVHWKRLPGLDEQMQTRPRRLQTLHLYAQAYRKTFKQCAVLARRSGGWRSWLFAHFWSSTLTQVPSTSAGLIVFEVFRRKFGIGADAVRIQKDGYDILLP